MGDRHRTDRDNINRLKNITMTLTENSKITLDDVLKKFQSDSRITEFTFPSNLSNTERAYIHYQATRLGFKSQSSGMADRRQLTISKSKQNNVSITKTLELSPRSLVAIQALDYASTPEKQFYSHSNHITTEFSVAGESAKSGYTNRLSVGPHPKIPRLKLTNKFDATRHRLPIWKHKEEILQVVGSHKVTFIKGDTGCGKTTQVPQFILEEANARQTEVRILCTVPRRIAAVTISDRVATERGEKVGFTVGYQIRLESCFSPCETLLTYCTSGVLLRSLTSFDYTILKNTTHIIIDEVHERDRQTDFLLACLRDVGLHFPNLRIILMGADMDSELLTAYFGGPLHCPLLKVEGRLHPVKTFFLEDVLGLMDYSNNEMQIADRQRQKGGIHKAQVYQGLVDKLNSQGSYLNNVSRSREKENYVLDAAMEMEMTNNARIYDVDGIIQRVWSYGEEMAWQEFIKLTNTKTISIDYQHSSEHVTMLMAVAARGMTDYVSILLTMGADASIEALIQSHGRYYTAKDWASDHGNTDLLTLFTDHEYNKVLKPLNHLHNIDPVNQQRLIMYQASFDDERVDLVLISRLLHRIHTSTDLGHAILVFLPGYEEIVTLKQMMFTDSSMRNLMDSIVVFLLHSNIQTGDQKAAFDKPRRGTRKILLSTNISETSLTIEDVVYVIDSGKVKEKSYDSMTGVTQLKSNWISKASANQRQGRAGRCKPGICYRLYSSSRYEFMAAFPTPEIVRTSLQELCLYTRAFIRGEMNVAGFFSRLPEPPAPIAVKKAVDMLIAMGALDEREQLTKLGLYLLDFPVEPSLGKALIYAIVLKCLDPVLTIISVVSYRDPFQLPGDPSEKQKALESKLQFSSDSMSDHMATLKAFQDWEKSKLFREGTEKRFCRDHYLSSACFEMVYGIRAQLLGQLRASGFVKSKGSGDLRDLNINSDSWALVKGVLTGTLYPNVCAINREKKCLYNEFESKISFHQSSTVIMKRKGGVLGIPTDWVVYDEICKQGNSQMIRGCTSVGDVALTIFAGNSCIPSTEIDGGGLTADLSEERDLLSPNLLRIDINRWISFQGTKHTINSVLRLREMLHDLMFKKLKSPAYDYTKTDEVVLQTIALVLVYEDETKGLKNVDGIGQWPKLVSGNMMSAPRQGYERSQTAMEEIQSESDEEDPIPSSLGFRNLRIA